MIRIEDIFRRNGIAYVVAEEGHIERLDASMAFQGIYGSISGLSHTGDRGVRPPLEYGSAKSFSIPRRMETRREALEAALGRMGESSRLWTAMSARRR